MTAEEYLKENNVVGMTELMVPILNGFADIKVKEAFKKTKTNTNDTQVKDKKIKK